MAITRLDAAPEQPISNAAHHRLHCAAACSDNLRGFFEQCFPTLLKRLFGYDGASWLNLVARVRANCFVGPRRIVVTG
jgi:hypothetical protein